MIISANSSCGVRSIELSIKRGAGVIELRIPTLELSHNVYFLSLKAYTKDGSPEWHDPADIHNQMYQFDVVSEQPTHGLIKFDAAWHGTQAR